MLPDFLSHLQINTTLVERLLTDFIHSEVTRVGLERAVIGLSGGVDSALAAFLAVRALGKENVQGVLMPYRASNPASRADAEAVVELLGIASRLIDITPVVDPYLNEYVQGKAGKTANETSDEAIARRRGNIMARARMLVLYDQSEAFGGLVVGTSNKTESLLGYTTQYGDNAVAIQPLGDLYKTQVWQLAEAVGVPPQIVHKAPSADLWSGQTDEGELGFTYTVADQVLYLLVDEYRHAEQVIALGFDKRVVQEIERRIRRNHFKRVPPPIAKVSPRTIGSDFLYPRDWGT